MCAEIERQLTGRFDTVRSFPLAGYDIGHCMGELDCFVKTPGRCRIHDEGQEIERAVHDAELVVLVTPLRYGGYAAQLKKAVDRLLPLILPFFRKAGDLTHHAMRYALRARWAAVAQDKTPSMERTRLFRAFAETSALNFGSPAWGAAVVGGDRAAWPAAIASALATPTAPGNACGTLQVARAELMRAARAADPPNLPAAAKGHRAADEPASSRGQYIAGDLEPSPAVDGSRGGAGRDRCGDWVRSRCGGDASGCTAVRAG